METWFTEQNRPGNAVFPILLSSGVCKGREAVGGWVGMIGRREVEERKRNNAGAWTDRMFQKKYLQVPSLVCLKSDLIPTSLGD